MAISVLVLTKNEEKDLPGCLDSVDWSDDIQVLDSMSSDTTVEIARAHGANVIQRPDIDHTRAFGGDESEYRNWALTQIPYKHPWVFVIDADERTTRELADEMQAAVASTPDHVAYRVRRRDFFMGTWLRHVQASPFYIRLFQPDKLRYERLVNPVTRVTGSIGTLNGHLDHFPFSKGLDHWIERHNLYSHFEAAQILRNRRAGQAFSLLKAFSARDFNERRFHQKELFYRLPCRPLMKFFLLYGLKRGFLDGRAGLTYAVLQSIYEYFIVLKVREALLLRDTETQRREN